ncbi:putative integral membrane protein [Streptomyces himastatinicus ATCC 53653]|uniref:Putative integral membrane protein n=1 Tax=Streptomyces himastatinicus ATCC 53653 TaxID=457427 RepID=D9WEK5_9ACTN|nr:hypothetical protein [Streptomyces himastatinicus]EFL25220.1 putative integral membrane protein [Streptomyces himastatinicus ATCC 53653]
MRPLPYVLGAAVLATLPVALPAPAAADDSSPSSFTIEDPRITESSGLAASRAHPGVYWTHNDSSDGAYVYAVDSKTGKTVARVELRGIGRPRDVEAISIGPDGNVYVGDIGDNLGGTWPHVWIYRFPEPKVLKNTTVTATQFTVKYEGGARNAEAMMVHPKTGRVYIASKSDDDPGLYEAPATLSAQGTNVFRRVADLDMEVTDGAFAPDGSRLVLRGYFAASEYRWTNGRPQDLKELKDQPGLPIQRQGESVTFTPEGGTLHVTAPRSSGSKVTAGRPSAGELLPGPRPRRIIKKDGDYSRAPTASKDPTRTRRTRTVLKAGLTFGAAMVLFLGLKRLVRRRPQ